MVRRAATTTPHGVKVVSRGKLGSVPQPAGGARSIEEHDETTIDEGLNSNVIVRTHALSSESGQASTNLRLFLARHELNMMHRSSFSSRFGYARNE